MLPAASHAIARGMARPASSSAYTILSRRSFASQGPPPPKPPPPPPRSDEEQSADKVDPAAAKEDASTSTPATQRPRGLSAFDIDTTLATIPDEGSGSKGGRTGARARSDRPQSSIEKSRRNWYRLAFLGMLGFGGYQLALLGRDWDTVKDRERFASDPSSSNALGRIKLRLKAAYDDFNAPVWEKLLPDPLPDPYQRPYTLVVDLDDLLVHSHWTREHGWRTAKRPGLDYFLGYLSQFWEIVLYTSQPFYAVGPIIEKLDPDRRFIAYMLFRESCRTLPNGQIVKDLSALNRDLSKVLVLDTDKSKYALHPENGVELKKWQGDRKDTELLDVLSFLEAIAIYNIADVRPVLKNYEGQYLPEEFARKQREDKQRRLAEWQASGSKPSGSSSSWGSLFSGIKGSSSPSAQGGAHGPPKTLFEQEQDRFRQQYVEEQKYWAENGEAMRKAAKEEQEKQMANMKFSVFDLLSGKQFDQAAQAAQQGGPGGDKK
ncbi:NIF-domain-containing protein [Jaminaea rosea]|uniref:Mitochondrial import inner membrane translocase subunit TIM50 n=1 Tax=Jaminaea rosea TaxID=1569628 RepID=A0A316UMU6_9BASI|nr:NIF-domain-containing protein [Jaminaea rosea]PWN26560.1 NIF-domain-containing protein [Jaminaea rosea]